VAASEAGQGDTERYSRLPRQADFWRLWLVGLVMFGVRWIELVVVGIFTYQVTRSAFIVTMLTLLRILPMALFGAFAGAATDRLNRRLALIVVLLVTLATSAAMALLALTGRLEVWHLAVSCFINGTAWATDMSLRRIMIGEVVGVDRMATAMALDAGASNASRMVGPALGGVLLATAGIQWVFILSVVLYLVAIAAALGLRYRNRVAPRAAVSMLGRIVEGLSEVRRSRQLAGFYVVTAIFNIFGWPFFSLIPVIGKDDLGLGPEGVGVLSSMDGAGALIGALSVIFMARPAHYHALYVGSVAVFQVLLIGFALMSQPVFAGAFLLMAGMASAFFAVMQSTLIYRSVAPALRARMLGLMSVCIGVGPIGFLQVGLLAEALGAKLAIVIIGVEGLVALLLTLPLWRSRGEGRSA
jgi:MFS family permease